MVDQGYVPIIYGMEGIKLIALIYTPTVSPPSFINRISKLLASNPSLFLRLFRSEFMTFLSKAVVQSQDPWIFILVSSLNFSIRVIEWMDLICNYIPKNVGFCPVDCLDFGHYPFSVSGICKCPHRSLIYDSQMPFADGNETDDEDDGKWIVPMQHWERTYGFEYDKMGSGVQAEEMRKWFEVETSFLVEFLMRQFIDVRIRDMGFGAGAVTWEEEKRQIWEYVEGICLDISS